jgi:YidC/Oxa1 family membrane protein insertase
MKSLQALQPHIKRLKQMYKHDRERLNREIIELYKRHRVNPLGGCLPLLLQLPIFFALFTTLRSAIELRGAHFVLWLKDLSVKDPYYVLPILMGITMFIQQRMSGMESGQSKMFALMPILFTILFMNFPAGLVLYWLIQNILTIGQQCLIKK